MLFSETERIMQLEADVKWLKEMIQLLVEYNAKQVEINRSFNEDIKKILS